MNNIPAPFWYIFWVAIGLFLGWATARIFKNTAVGILVLAICLLGMTAAMALRQ